MSERLGDAILDLRTDDSGLGRGIDQAQRKSDRLGRSFDGITGKLGTLTKAMATLGVGLSVAGLVRYTRATMLALDQQAKLARAIGGSTAALQALDRAADRAGVQKSELASAATRLNQRLGEVIATGKGADDTFKALGITAQELAAMDIDERFAAISDRMRDAGMSSQEMSHHLRQLGIRQASVITLLQGGGDEIRKSREAVDRLGVTISEVDARQIEAANDAMAEAGRVFEGIGNRLAVAVAPAVERLATGFVTLATYLFGARVELDQFFDSLDRARGILGDKIFDRLLGQPGAIREHRRALGQLADAFDAVRHSVMQSADRLDEYAMLLDAMGGMGAADVIRQFAAALEAASDEFDAGTISAEEFHDKLESIKGRAEHVLADLAQISGMAFDPAIVSLEQLGEALDNAAGRAANLRAELPGGGGAEDDDRDTPTTPTRPRTGGGGGGRGGRDEYAASLERLIDNLRTQREILDDWYHESQDLLENRRALEILGEEEHRDALLRVEERYQEQLAEMRADAYGARLDDAGKFFGAMAGITEAGGRKLVRATRIFGALEAAANTLRAQAQVLADPRLGFMGKLAAYAAIGAAGAGVVASLRGGGGSGGGASAAGAAGSAAIAQQQATQTMNFTIQNDPFGIGENIIRQLVPRFNEAARNGLLINARIT